MYDRTILKEKEKENELIFESTAIPVSYMGRDEDWQEKCDCGLVHRYIEQADGSFDLSDTLKIEEVVCGCVFCRGEETISQVYCKKCGVQVHPGTKQKYGVGKTRKSVYGTVFLDDMPDKKDDESIDKFFNEMIDLSKHFPGIIKSGQGVVTELDVNEGRVDFVSNGEIVTTCGAKL